MQWIWLAYFNCICLFLNNPRNETIISIFLPAAIAGILQADAENPASKE
jgi:hypothetical protein